LRRGKNGASFYLHVKKVVLGSGVISLGRNVTGAIADLMQLMYSFILPAPCDSEKQMKISPPPLVSDYLSSSW
jgi:hypothetical protein